MNKRELKVKKEKKNMHLGYTTRIVLYFLFFVIAFILGVFFLTKTFDIDYGESIKYEEKGNIDYNVYLKNNEFYEESYLPEGMSYVASIIKNIKVDINYKFNIEELVDTNYSYKIMAKLVINDSNGKSKLFEKDYLLKEVKNISSENQYIQEVNDSVVIDYDKYNELANNFKSTYGVDTGSNLIIYISFDKNITNDEKNININNTSEMSLAIPLSQKTINIEMSDTGINYSGRVITDTKVTFINILSGLISLYLFQTSIVLVIFGIHFCFQLVPKVSKYDRYVKKVLNQYDRLITETSTQPNLENKEVKIIKKFEELLDARDALKSPIMYCNIVSHQKSCFYIETDTVVYLYVVKSSSFEVEK